MIIYDSYAFRELMFTCDYLYRNNEMYFAKSLKIFESSGIMTVLNDPRRGLNITLLNMKRNTPTISSVNIYLCKLIL